MKRLIIFSSLAIIFAAVGLFAQGALDQEPHHKRVLYTNDLRMFDVTIVPGQATGDHLHAHDMATLVLGTGTVRVQRNGVDVTPAAMPARGAVVVAEHTGAPATYSIGNTGTADYHVIEVENLREGGGWPASKPLTAPGTSIVADTRAFTIYDLRLNAGAPKTMHAHTWPTVIVLVDGAMENGGIGGEEPIQLRQPGQWMFLPRGSSHTVTPVGGDAHVVEIEVR